MRGQQAFEVISEAAGVLVNTALVAGRALREADVSLWPLAGHGDRSQHVYPHHLSNLLLSLAGGSPGEAADVAVWYRGLRRNVVEVALPPVLERLAGVTKPSTPCLWPEEASLDVAGVSLTLTLGEVLDTLIDRLSEPEQAREIDDSIEIELRNAPLGRNGIAVIRLYGGLHVKVLYQSPQTELLSVIPDSVIVRSSEVDPENRTGG